ncbi:hypothetical protein [Streptomyces calvus]
MLEYTTITHDQPENPVEHHAAPPIRQHFKPRFATALFRRYLRACIVTGPDPTVPPAGTRSKAVLADAQRIGHRHHH